MNQSEVGSPSDTVPPNAHQRWQKLVHMNDPKQIWSAINWKGTVAGVEKDILTPSDTEFCEHFDALLIPSRDATVVIYMFVLR